MIQNSSFTLSALAVLLSVVSACAGTSDADIELIGEEYSPQYTAKERQLRTFDTLWKYFGENYIRFESVELDWDGVQ